MATLLGRRSKTKDKPREEEPGGQMSFLDHLDELRRRIIRCVVFVFVAFFGCWFVSDHIYNFLAIPVQRALAEAQRHQVDISGLKGDETLASSRLNELATGVRVEADNAPSGGGGTRGGGGGRRGQGGGGGGGRGGRKGASGGGDR